jgi:PAS domain S-box-containing protein
MRAPVTAWPFSRGDWLHGSIVALSILAAGLVGFILPIFGAHFNLPLLPSGIAVAACCRWGRRMWPFIFAAVAAVDFWHLHILVGSLGLGAGVIEAFAVGAGLAGGGVLAAWLLERNGFNTSFARARDVPLFILSAAAGMTLMPAFGYLGFMLAGQPSGLSWENWFSWWSNITAGVLVVGPILIPMSRQSLARLTDRSWLEVGLWLLGVVSCCAAILLLGSPNVRPLLSVYAVLLIVVGAMRFDLVVTASAAFVISMTIALSAAFSHGAYSQLDKFSGLTIVWSITAALTGLSLIITALLAERDGESGARLRAERRYAQIFEGSPQPVWVHSRDTGKFLLVNAAAERQYGWSREEFLSRSVADLAPAGQPRVLPEPGEEGTEEPAGSAARNEALAAAAEPFETRHRTGDGRVLDVEVWTRSIDLAGQPATLVFAIDVTERRAFGQALSEAIAGEQRRIGQEMHDGLGQELTGLSLSVQALANRAKREWASHAAELQQLAALAASCIQGARLIVQGLSPLSDADGSLEAALEALSRRSSLSGTPVRFKARLEAPLSIGLETRNHLYRSAQEAVQNALKHAGGTLIEIELSANAGRVRLSVADNGRGLPADAMRGQGLGMRTMRFRARSISGRLFVGPAEAGGNRVVCDLAQLAARRESA